MIDQTAVLLSLNNLKGYRVAPGGEDTDFKRYIQYAFDYAWRYYPWSFSTRRYSLDLVNDPYMPEDFDIDGSYEPATNLSYNWQKVALSDFDLYDSGDYAFALQYDPVVNKYEIRSTSTGALSIVYQTKPPTLAAGTMVPFPSAMTVALGAVIYAKMGDNPTRADVTQEWDQFHAELDRHVGRADKNRAPNRRRNRYDIAGVGTGES